MPGSRAYWFCLAAVLPGLWVGGPALASSPPTRPHAVLLSLTALMDPLFSLRYERELDPGFGVAVLAGGSVHGAPGFDSMTVAELGAQGLYVIAGTWDGGLHAGVDLRAACNAAVTGSVAGDAEATSRGTRLRAAGLLGLRWTGRSGLTVEAQWLAGVRRSAGAATGGVDRAAYEVTGLESRAELAVGLAF